MIHSLMSRVLSAPDSPTADLYFLNACGDFLSHGVKRLAPTVFASSSAVLVMRHGLRAGRLPRDRQLIYFLDDLPREGLADGTLAFRYRQKLRLVEGRAQARMARGAELVVSSPRIADSLPGARVLHPYWSEPLADLGHFQPLIDGHGWCEVAFLGSSVHRGGLDFLAPVVGATLAAHSNVRFHLAERHKLPPGLAGHPRVCRIPGGGWTAYRTGLAARRFHIALYPLAETPFNMARSRNKLIEHAVVGAAPLYSSHWGPSAEAVRGGAGLALENCRAVWQAALGRLVTHPSEAASVAVSAGALARRLNDPAPQRRLWSRLLGVQADEGA